MSTRSDTPIWPRRYPLSCFPARGGRRGPGRPVPTEALADVDGALRPAVQAVSFHAMRYLGWADAVGRELVQRYPNVLFESLLLVSLTLLKAEGEAAPPCGHAGHAPHTVVDQAVTAASKARALAAFKGLLNGCLRRFLREREALAAAVADSPVEPPGLVGQAAARGLSAALAGDPAGRQSAGPDLAREPPPRQPRTGAGCVPGRGLAAEPVGAAGLVVATPRPVVQLPGFAEGWWSVQDAGAQRAAELLAPADGMRVLDACEPRLAWSGSPARPEPDRLGLGGDRVRLQAADAADLDAWWDGKPFDAVLADVPCTASGIVRRHPSAGCAAKTTCAAPPRCRPASWMPCGAPWRRAGAC